MEVDIFYSTVCHVCKSVSDSKCSGCRLLSYCCRKHQQQDWHRHKELCCSVQALLKETGKDNIFSAVEEMKSIKDWSEMRIKAMYHTETKMGRPLRAEERQMFLFPSACRVCFKTYPSPLKPCPGCRCISYCSEDHRTFDFKAHRRSCKKFKLCFDLDVYMLGPSFKYPQVISYPNEEKRALFKSIKSFVEEFIAPDESKFRIIPQSETLTCITTLMYSLELSGRSSFKSGKLTVHIVGACQLEYSLLETLEVLLHWFRDLRELEVALIGPECPEYSSHVELCGRCGESRTVSLDIRSGSLYHQYLDSPSSSIPDVIVAYNCGLHEFYGEASDPWTESVPRFLAFPYALLVLTSYNKLEAERDLNRVLSLENCLNRPKLLLECQQNPFRSLRPYRDWELNSDGIFYQNNIISIVEAVP